MSLLYHSPPKPSMLCGYFYLWIYNVFYPRPNLSLWQISQMRSFQTKATHPPSGWVLIFGHSPCLLLFPKAPYAKEQIGVPLSQGSSVQRELSAIGRLKDCLAGVCPHRPQTRWRRKPSVFFMGAGLRLSPPDRLRGETLRAPPCTRKGHCPLTLF